MVQRDLYVGLFMSFSMSCVCSLENSMIVSPAIIHMRSTREDDLPDHPGAAPVRVIRQLARGVAASGIKNQVS